MATFATKEKHFPSKTPYIKNYGKEKKKSIPTVFHVRARRVQIQTTSFLTAAILIYAAEAGITAAAGTRLALQLILIVVFEYDIHCDYKFTNDKRAKGVAIPRCCLNDFCADIGQFARLLPTLAVVAKSQAPSPE